MLSVSVSEVGKTDEQELRSETVVTQLLCEINLTSMSQINNPRFSGLTAYVVP